MAKRKKIGYDRRKDMTKKAWLELQKSNRQTNGFNTGTRDMKTAKLPTRAMEKAETRKMIQDY